MRLFTKDMETGSMTPVKVPPLHDVVVTTVNGKFVLGEKNGDLEVRTNDGTLVLRFTSANTMHVGQEAIQ